MDWCSAGQPFTHFRTTVGQSISNAGFGFLPVCVVASQSSEGKGNGGMNVHLINPSTVSFGTAVITPRWQYVLAGATPRSFGDPNLVDETLLPLNPECIQPGDAVGIGIHTANALRRYEIGKIARARGAFVIFGGIHSTLYPEEARELGGAHSVVKGDGDIEWARALMDCRDGMPKPLYIGGQIEASDLRLNALFP
jgi:hypothetical protein